jgi:hypothetical protein
VPLGKQFHLQYQSKASLKDGSLFFVKEFENSLWVLAFLLAFLFAFWAF